MSRIVRPLGGDAVLYLLRDHQISNTILLSTKAALFKCFPGQLTMPLKEAASLLWDFYRDPLRSLTLLSLNVSSQKS